MPKDDKTQSADANADAAVPAPEAKQNALASTNVKEEASKPALTSSSAVKERSLPKINKLPPGYIPLWIIALTSLLLNILLINQLLQVRALAAVTIGEAAMILEGFGDETFSYNFTFDDTLNIQTEIPVNETIPVEINEQIDISTVVNVPIRTPLGNTSANVPINTTIPIDLDFEVPLEQTFEVQAAVPISLSVPVEIGVEETPLGGALDEMVANLYDLSAELSQPIVALGAGSQSDNSTTIEVTATPSSE